MSNSMTSRAPATIDVVGHYNRPDVFHLVVNESSSPAVSVTPAADTSVAENRLELE